MNVLFVNPSPIRGGAEEMLLAFATGFDPARVHAEVACLAPGSFPSELQRAGVVVHSIEAGRMRQASHYVRAVRRLGALARDFDAVCSWQVKGHYYGTPAARIARTPALWWDHGIRAGFFDGWVPRALRADAVFTSSRAAARAHRNARAIHPGIAVERFDHRSAHAGHAVGIVGRLQPWKGQHVFLQAAARLTQPRVRFVVAGDAIGGFSAGYPADLRALASSLGIAGRVDFIGHRDDVPEVLKRLDVFVHASKDEPFGIVILEAMAAGVPVVATRGGGVDEIVSHEETGLLVDHGDHEAMAAAISRFLDDPVFAAECARRAHRSVLEHFTVERMVDEFTVVLESFAPAKALA